MMRATTADRSPSRKELGDLCPLVAVAPLCLHEHSVLLLRPSVFPDAGIQMVAPPEQERATRVR